MQLVWYLNICKIELEWIVWGQLNLNHRKKTLNIYIRMGFLFLRAVIEKQTACQLHAKQLFALF